MIFDYEYIATKFLLIFFGVLGLRPFAVQTSPGLKLSKQGNRRNSSKIQFSPSRLGCLYNLFIIAVQLRILSVAMPVVFSDEYPGKTSITVAIEVCVSVLSHSAALTIYLILGFRQRTAVRQLNRLLTSDRTMVNRCGNRKCESSRNFIFLVFLTNFFVMVGLQSTEYMAYKFPIISFFRVHFPDIIITWFTTQYIILIKLIYNRIKAINQILADLFVVLPSDNTPRLFVASEVYTSDLQGSKILNFRRVNGNLYEIAKEISEFYSLPILLAIAHFCSLFIYSAYFLIVQFVVMTEAYSVVMVVNSLFAMAGSMLPIVLLASGITNLNAEMKKTVDIAKKLFGRRNINRDDKVQLKQFTFELMHREVRFTAFGFFSLDCTLVHSILSMVTTYLIILIQHQKDRQ